MILALDLGTTTGWAMQDGGIIMSGSQSFKATRYQGGGMRFLMFKSWLNKFTSPSSVYFEEVRRHAGTDAAHVYGGFLAMLTSWCEENNIPYLGIPVGTIKKHATGKGNASKFEMMAASENRYGITPKDDNEADAICLLHYVVDDIHRDFLSSRFYCARHRQW